MADSTLEAKVLLDVAQVKSAVASARAAFKGLEGAVGGLDAKLTKADKALTKGASSHQVLASAGIRTEAGIRAQIAALEQLKTVAGKDSVALRQITNEQKRLKEALSPATADIARQMRLLDQASTGGKKFGDSMTHAGAASHRANLFMINFSRGIEDLKFGLPAVINNLEGIALGYQMMAKEAKAAEKSVASVIMASLTSPAGMLALLNLAITTAFLLGPTLKKAFNKGKIGAKELSKVVSSIVEVDTSDFDAMFRVDSAEQAQRVVDGLKDRIRGLGATIAASMSGTNQWAAGIFALSQGFGAVGESVSKMLIGVMGNAEAKAALALQDQFAKIAAEMEAAAIMAELLEKHLDSIKPPGSLARIEHDISKLEKAFDSASDMVERQRIARAIDELKAAADTASMDRIVGDLGKMGAQASYLEGRINAATTAFERHAYQQGLGAVVLDKLRHETDRYTEGSLQRLDAELAVMEEQMQQAETATERLAIAQEMYAKQAGKRVEDQLRRVNEELKDFNMNAALSLGEAAVGGAFEGFFAGFDKADADRARLAIIETKKAFAGLEEQFASGEITYEEFALRNKILTGEMRDAQEELAKATRDNFELMADRIGNAFEAVARSVKKAFASIAQDYVNMIVRKGILKLFGTALGIAPGLGGSAALGVLSSGVSIPDIPSVSAGAAPLGRAQNIGLIATLIPSGDIRIAGEKSSAIRSRLGV